MHRNSFRIGSLGFGLFVFLSFAAAAQVSVKPAPASSAKEYSSQNAVSKRATNEEQADLIDAVDEADALGWETDLDEAFERTKRSGKPIVAMFVSNWASPVAAMIRETLSNKQVRKILRTVEAVVIDVDADSERAGEMKIDQLPTFVVLDSNGKEYDRFSGFLPPGAFIPTLQAAADPKQSIPELINHIERSPKDLEARWLLAKKYARDKRADDLTQVLDGLRDADPENRRGYLDNVAYLELMTSIDPRMPADGVRAAERFLREYPKSEFAPEVDMTLAQLAYQMGEKDRCLQILEEFPKRYPKSPLASQVAHDLEAIRSGK